MNRVYLDYSATTPLDPRVLDQMVLTFSTTFGNASSVHSFGREARTILERSREQVAALIGADPDEVFFTSGGTEADNHALKGLAQSGAKAGKREIIISAAEHHAVLHPAESLRQGGFDVKILPVDGFGRVDPTDLKNAIGPGTAAVSLMYANNEVGSLNPIAELGAIAQEAGVPFHTDAVQAVGKIPVLVKNIPVDVLSVSAHKFFGPKGIGAIYIRKGTRVETFMEGGAQESNRRAGTESVALAVGLGCAAELAGQEMSSSLSHIRNLRERLRSKLFEQFEGIIENGHPADAIPHILNVSFDFPVFHLDGDALIMGMDLRGVAVTSGSACTSGSLQPSHVLIAMGREPRTARASIRFSIGRISTTEEIDYAVEALKNVVATAGKNVSSN